MQYELDSISKQVAEALLPSRLISAPITESLGIPLLAEGDRVENLWKTLQIALESSKASQLIIIFVNQRECDGSEITKSNLRTLKFFNAGAEDFYAYKNLGKHSLVLVNGTRNEFKLKEEEGVGRARKVIADLALCLFKKGILQSELHRQTDGDVKVPASYFSADLDKVAVGATYPFFHSQGELGEEEFRGLKKYERWLESYTEGLAFAGSRYAFWPLGSTLFFRLSAYEKVRGIPNVRAGEDFHFLSKLSKVGHIEKLNVAPIELRGRHSSRVPFGTGRALGNMKTGEKSYEEFPSWLFEELKGLLSEIDSLAECESAQSFFSSRKVADQPFFEEFKSPFEKILSQRNSIHQKRKQLHESFDALKTMRWVNSKVKSYPTRRSV